MAIVTSADMESSFRCRASYEVLHTYLHRNVDLNREFALFQTSLFIHSILSLLSTRLYTSEIKSVLLEWMRVCLIREACKQQWNKIKSCVYFSGDSDYMQVKWLFQVRFLEHHNNNSIITVITLSGCITVIQNGTLEKESLFEFGPN